MIKLRKSILLILSVIILGALIILSSCNRKSDKDKAIEYFQEHTFDEGVAYYIENRLGKPWLDSLYITDIVPTVCDSGYFFTRDNLNKFDKTPVLRHLKEYMFKARPLVLEYVRNEIAINRDLQRDAFVKHVLPTIEMSVDSLIEKNAEDVVNEYAGGFMNYRKLAFYVGRNNRDFKKMFDKHIKFKSYVEFIDNLANVYIDSLNSYRKSYYFDLTGKHITGKWKINLPPAPAGIYSTNDLQNYVKKFTEKERDEISEELLRDWVEPALIGIVSGGAETLYDIGTLTYDVVMTLKDVETAELDSNEQLEYVIQDIVSNQLKRKYMVNLSNIILVEIDKMYQDLWERIARNI